MGAGDELADEFDAVEVAGAKVGPEALLGVGAGAAEFSGERG